MVSPVDELLGVVPAHGADTLWGHDHGPRSPEACSNPKHGGRPRGTAQDWALGSAGPLPQVALESQPLSSTPCYKCQGRASTGAPPLRSPLTSPWGRRETARGSPSERWECDRALPWGDLGAPEAAKTHEGRGAGVLPEQGWQWRCAAAWGSAGMVCVCSPQAPRVTGPLQPWGPGLAGSQSEGGLLCPGMKKPKVLLWRAVQAQLFLLVSARPWGCMMTEALHLSPRPSCLKWAAASCLLHPLDRALSVSLMSLVTIMTLGQKKKYFKELFWQRRMDKRHHMPFHGGLHKDTWKPGRCAVPAGLSEESSWDTGKSSVGCCGCSPLLSFI